MSQRETVERGLEALRQGDWTAAIEHLEAAVADRPTDGEAVMYLGIAHGQAGHTEPALATLDRAGSLMPGDPRPLFNRARLHQKLGDTAAAAEGYRAALRLDPAYGKAREALAQLGEPVEVPTESPTEAARGRAFERLSGETAATAVAEGPVGLDGGPIAQPVASSDSAYGGAYGPPPERPTTALDGRSELISFDIISVIKVMGLFGVVSGLLLALPQALQQYMMTRRLSEAAVMVAMMVIGGPIIFFLFGLLSAALYNWLGRSGGFVFDSSPDGDVVRVAWIDPVRFATVTTKVLGVLLGVLLVPTILIMAVIGAAAGGQAPMFTMLVGVVGGVIGGTIGLLVAWVLYYLLGVIYNALSGVLGGIQFNAQRSGAGNYEVRSLRIIPTALSTGVPNALSILPFSLLMIVLIQAIPPMPGVDKGGMTLAYVLMPVFLVISYAIYTIAYNIVAKMVGGMVVRVNGV